MAIVAQTSPAFTVSSFIGTVISLSPSSRPFRATCALPNSRALRSVLKENTSMRSFGSSFMDIGASKTKRSRVQTGFDVCFATRVLLASDRRRPSRSCTIDNTQNGFGVPCSSLRSRARVMSTTTRAVVALRGGSGCLASSSSLSLLSCRCCGLFFGLASESSSIIVGLPFYVLYIRDCYVGSMSTLSLWLPRIRRCKSAVDLLVCVDTLGLARL
mmetsp:Transcript_6597/g.18479  ORF Transcript_6597/g.18479 Transcript_6597/m.18479 type:complete len:215 (-) Transcript_6597:668-1312(-)